MKMSKIFLMISTLSVAILFSSNSTALDTGGRGQCILNKDENKVVAPITVRWFRNQADRDSNKNPFTEVKLFGGQESCQANLYYADIGGEHARITKGKYCNFKVEFGMKVKLTNDACKNK